VKTFIDNNKEVILRLVKWLKDNPYPPQNYPSKSTTLFKKKPTNFPNNVNKSAHESCNSYFKFSCYHLY